MVGVVGVVGVVVVGVGGEYCPTTMITVLPFLTVVPPDGDCLRTTPLRCLFITVLVCCTTLNPAA